MKVLFNKELYFAFLKNKNKILAYSIHYSQDRVIEHLKKIARFHNLEGEIIIDTNLEDKFYSYIVSKLEKDVSPKFDLSLYRNNRVYEYLLNIRKGEVTTYSQIAKETGYNIWKVIRTLAYNPFIILIPCHRIIRKDGEVSGYTPLGKDFKILLLKKEGYL